MTAVAGFIALHAVLIALGGSALWAAGLVDPVRGRAGSVWAALGPAYVLGVALLMPWLVIILLLHIPATFGTAAVVALLGIIVMLLVGRRLGRMTAPSSAAPSSVDSATRSDVTTAPRRRLPSLRALAVVGAGGLVGWGTLVLSRLPTGNDDARIWSLRGVTLADYARLVPEIFLNQSQSGAHPVYPLLQPEFEATVSRALGHAAPSFFHAELWLLFICSVWTAGYLIWRRLGPASGTGIAVWLPAVALLAVIPAEVSNIIIGDADTTGSVFLALGVLCAGLWLDAGARRYLALSAVMLTAAASTKDEDLLAAAIVCVILVVGVAARVVAGRHRWRAWERLLPLLGLAAYFVVFVAPWRLWLNAHHLIDGVQPPIPKAINPLYFLGRGDQLRETVTAMLTQSLGEWDWLIAIFLVVCGVCLASPRIRQVACFYLAAFWTVVLGLVWLYTTTPEPLSYLLPTSMGRTVAVFMAMTPLAVAHLLAASTAGSAVTTPTD